MPKAEIKRGQPSVKCPGCGGSGSPSVKIITPNGVVAWIGCEWCLGRADTMGQKWVIERLCRDADARAGRPMPGLPSSPQPRQIAS